MGLSPSIEPPPRGGEVSGRSRWPPQLQGISLASLCSLYTSFRELSSASLPVEQLATVLSLPEDEALTVAEIWGASPVDGVSHTINLFELLMALAATSFSLTLQTKLVFFFRIWDCNKDSHVDVVEMAFLLRTLIYSLGQYCSWGHTYLPDARAIRKYVERTFRSSISEDEFVRWAMRHRLLRSTLVSFTPSTRGLVDNVDFVLSGPKEATVSRRPAKSNVIADAGTPSDLAAVRLPQVSSTSKSAQQPQTPREPQGSTALPVVTPRRGLTNKPLNFGLSGAAAGQLQSLDATASWQDLGFTCPLHKDVGRKQCMVLTKHEVLLINRLWHFFRENPELEFHSVRGLLKMLEGEVAKQDSLVAESQHRNIFKLTDTRNNRFFEVCVRRFHNGENVSFREFLQGVCPCASKARLDLFENWHQTGHWFQEQAFVKQVKLWRRECESHWKKPALTTNERQCLEQQMSELDVNRDRLLSVDDLVEGALVAPDIASEIIKKHDINGDSLLNLNEFLLMFCPEGERSKSSAVFEELMRSKFRKVIHRWKNGLDASFSSDTMEKARQAFRELDENADGGLSLDDLVGHVDLKTAFGLMETYDADTDGELSFSEFQRMVDPNQTTSGPNQLMPSVRPISRRQ